MLDVSDISDKSYSLATLGLQQGGTGLCHPLDIVKPAFVASIISSRNELQIAYPDINDILADGQCSLPTVQTLHITIQQFSKFDKRISTKSLLRIEWTQIPKLQNILYRKFREGKNATFLNSIESDDIALTFVGSASTSFGSAWVERSTQGSSVCYGSSSILDC